MSPNSKELNNSMFWKSFAAILFGPWAEIFAELMLVSRKAWRGMTNEGIYEVIDYEVTLELLNKAGSRAKLQKREKVKYLQDHIIAYQDQAWADGDILLDYKCSPGVEVDRYTPGHKTLILISLRDERQKGDIDEFNIEWGMEETFLREKEQWEVEISHKTRALKFNLIFPKSRPPIQVTLIEYLRKRSRSLETETIQRLTDGKWKMSWSTNNPRLNERYIFQWEW